MSTRPLSARNHRRSLRRGASNAAATARLAADRPAPYQTPIARQPLPRGFRLLLWLCLIGLLLTIGHEVFWRQHLKRFDVVRPGVLYRSAQPSQWGLRWLADHYHLKTILCLRAAHPRLRRGVAWVEDEPSGRRQGELASELGMNCLCCPLGEQVYWPWLTPWHFERFYTLLDNPANHPVLVHCWSGRHRTGTFAALFRLEYDRWTPQRAINELHSYSFGLPRPIQQHNLRTYLPRPRPNRRQWEALHAGLASVLQAPRARDYAALVRNLRQQRTRSPVATAVADYVEQKRPFAVPLAARLIDTLDDPLVPAAVDAARQILDNGGAPYAISATAAGLLADFGTADDHQALLRLLQKNRRQPEVDSHYAAIVAGVTNRYTPNRLCYLRPLLEDRRRRIHPDAARYRFCDTAVARLTSIVDEPFLPDHDPSPADWDAGVEAALGWFAEHPEATQPRRFEPPRREDYVPPPKMEFADSKPAQATDAPR